MKLLNGLVIGLLLATSQMASALENFSVRDTVQVNWDDGTVSRGEILAIYRNDSALVYFKDRENAVVPLSALNQPVSEMNGFKRGDRVDVNWKNESPDRGEILQFYRNKTALVYFSDRENEVVPLDMLSLPIQTMGGFKIKDVVHVNWGDGSVSKGEILKMYRNGSALIYFKDRSDEVVPLSALNTPITSVEFPR